MVARAVCVGELICVTVGPEFIRRDWVKPGATVIDVGINRVAWAAIRASSATFRAVEVAGAITPMPGRVGLMTIGCLLVNTLFAACMQAGVPLASSRRP